MGAHSNLFLFSYHSEVILSLTLCCNFYCRCPFAHSESPLKMLKRPLSTVDTTKKDLFDELRAADIAVMPAAPLGSDDPFVGSVSARAGPVGSSQTRAASIADDSSMRNGVAVRTDPLTEARAALSADAAAAAGAGELEEGEGDEEGFMGDE